MTDTKVKIGDTFVYSWGYDQTNVDFYEVVKISATGKTGKACKVRKVTVDDGDNAYSGITHVVPATGPDRFMPATENYDGRTEYTYRAATDRVTVNHYGDHAYRWDGKPEYETATGWGH